MYQEDSVQMDKIEVIITSVKEEYQRKIDTKNREKDQFKEKLKDLDE